MTGSRSFQFGVNFFVKKRKQQLKIRLCSSYLSPLDLRFIFITVILLCNHIPFKL